MNQLTLKDRLFTFVNAPYHIQNQANTLSKAGFSYTGNSDLIHCIACHIVITGNHQYANQITLHKRLAPYCPTVIKWGQRPTLSLNQLIVKEDRIPVGIHLFQAIYRLQHYITQSTTHIESDLIDEESTAIWNQRMSKTERQKFRSIKATIKMDPLRLKFIFQSKVSEPQSAKEWYNKIQLLKHPHLYKDLQPTHRTEQLDFDWLIEHQSTKDQFKLLEIMDIKRHEATKLENMLSRHGMTVGFTTRKSKEISIKSNRSKRHMVLISVYLSNKIPQLIREL